MDLTQESASEVDRDELFMIGFPDEQYPLRRIQRPAFARQAESPSTTATDRSPKIYYVRRLEDKAPIRIEYVERMTKGVDSGDRSKSGDVRDGSSLEPHEPNSKSLGPASGTGAVINHDGTDGSSSCLIDRCGFRQWRQEWRVARQARKDAKRGVPLLCRTPCGVTPVETKGYTIKSDGRNNKARFVLQRCI